MGKIVVVRFFFCRVYQFENKKFECLSYRKKTLELSNKLTFLYSAYWMYLLHMEAV